MFEENNQHAREIPGQCQQRDFTQVPAEFDLFQSHRHYSCGRSDNQQAATSGTLSITADSRPVIPAIV